MRYQYIMVPKDQITILCLLFLPILNIYYLIPCCVSVFLQSCKIDQMPFQCDKGITGKPWTIYSQILSKIYWILHLFRWQKQSHYINHGKLCQCKSKLNQICFITCSYSMASTKRSKTIRWWVKAEVTTSAFFVHGADIACTLIIDEAVMMQACYFVACDPCSDTYVSRLRSACTMHKYTCIHITQMYYLVTKS